jgi:hypothetical protein
MDGIERMLMCDHAAYMVRSTNNADINHTKALYPTPHITRSVLGACWLMFAAYAYESSYTLAYAHAFEPVFGGSQQKGLPLKSSVERSCAHSESAFCLSYLHDLYQRDTTESARHRTHTGQVCLLCARGTPVFPCNTGTPTVCSLFKRGDS